MPVLYMKFSILLNGLKWEALGIISFIFIFITAAYANGAEILTANVLVPCPFSVSLATPNNVYILPLTTNITFQYALSNSICSGYIDSGFLNVTNSRSVTVYSIPANYEIMNGVIPIPYKSFPNATSSYSATIAFSSNYFTNQSSAAFEVVEPAILKIYNLSAGQTISPGSILTISQNINNIGFLSPNNMALHTEITGPNAFKDVVNTSVSSTGFISFTVNGVTNGLGRYYISENVSYYNGASNAISPNVTTAYTVASAVSPTPPPTGPPAPSPSKVQEPITIISTAFLSSIPILTGAYAGYGAVSEIELTDIGSLPVWVNMSVPKITEFGSVSISQNAIYLLPDSNLSVQIFYKTNSNVTPGEYVVPINFSVSQIGHRSSSETLFPVLSITNMNDKPSAAAASLTFQSASGAASGSIKVSNPYNHTVYNATVSVSIPSIALSNTSSFLLSGAAGNITKTEPAYVLNWFISEMPRNASTYVYYYATNVIEPELLASPETQVSIPPSAQSSLTVFQINIPTFYAGTESSINVSSFYTGQKPENVTYNLVSQPSMIVQNPFQVFRAMPNQEINTEFYVNGAKNPGTYLLTLYIQGAGINKTYSLPVLVLQKPAPPPSSPPQISNSTSGSAGVLSASVLKPDILYPLGAAVAAVIFFTAILFRYRRPAGYNAQRVKRLQELKEQIGRSERG